MGSTLPTVSTSSVSAASQDPESPAPPAEVVIAREVAEAPVKSGRRRDTCGWGLGFTTSQKCAAVPRRAGI